MDNLMRKITSRKFLMAVVAVVSGLAMSFELAAYGILVGLFYSRSRWKCVVSLYRALFAAMLGGRLVWGGGMVVLTGMSGSGFTWAMFLSGAFLNAIPGIILQLIFIPTMMIALDRTGLVRFHRKKHHKVSWVV